MQRKLVTVLLIFGAIVIAFAMIQSNKNDSKQTTSTLPTPNQDVTSPEASEAPETPQVTETSPTPAPIAAPVITGPMEMIEGLRVRDVTDLQPEPVLGSVGADQGEGGFELEAQFTPWGGGVKSVKLTDYVSEVGGEEPYVVLKQLMGETDPYCFPMAASWIRVNAGDPIYLLNKRWVVSEQTERSVSFSLVIESGTGDDVLRIKRTWSVEVGRYDLSLAQSFENLSGQPLKFRFGMYGPVDLPEEGGYLGDRDRHVIVGYVEPPRSASGAKRVLIDGYDRPRAEFFGDDTPDTVWPGEDEDPNRDVAWVATTNRYFTTMVYQRAADRSALDTPLERRFPRVRRALFGDSNDSGRGKLALVLESAELTLAGAGEAATGSLDVEVYAGPRVRSILRDDPRHSVLSMGQVIVYSMGGPCAMCTFAWLAEGLLSFLTLMADWSGDWGLAIIILVAVVRTLLHPLTKKSQVNMMVMSKKMGALQPDIEKLKAKYPDNQKKMNEEMMKLYKEKNVNPAAMGLGCLPMFLQMPIWIALYAMLYYAIELRHEAAFWGVFQYISGGDWGFMADMASQDHFLSLGEGFTIPVIGTQINSLNILPLLMGFVFFLQQKYTTAQSTAAMSDQQIQQQKMMKWMIMLFPVMLYKAPCGLTLYILTSTSVGIIESKRVRAHIKEMEENGGFDAKDGGGKKPKGPKPGGFMDRMMKAAEARQQEVAQQKTPGAKPVKSKSKKKRGQL